MTKLEYAGWQRVCDEYHLHETARRDEREERKLPEIAMTFELQLYHVGKAQANWEATAHQTCGIEGAQREELP